jgi:hypothetical protein
MARRGPRSPTLVLAAATFTTLVTGGCAANATVRLGATGDVATENDGGFFGSSEETKASAAATGTAPAVPFHDGCGRAGHLPASRDWAGT